MTRFDVITLGESMLRLSPPDLLRLEQARSLEVQVAGSESNTAVGLARLGLRVCWLSRLTSNPLGRLLVGEVARHGVDTSHVRWTDDARVGVYYLEEAKPPRATRVVYDRAGSAMSLIRPDDLPSELFVPDGARLFHTTGITLALGASAAATAKLAMTRAKELGWLLSFDLNYRAKLWSPSRARAGCDEALRLADLIFVPRRDARVIFELGDDDGEGLLEAVAAHCPQALVVLTRGADGALARTPDGDAFAQPAFPAVEVDRVGGGDAFSAGFLYGYLRGGADRVPTALRWGAAVAALKYGIRGDLPLVDPTEVEALLRGDSGGTIAR